MIRNCHFKGAVQTKGGKLESYAYKRLDADAQKAVHAEGGKPESCTNQRPDTNVQKQCNANKKTKPSVIINPMVMGNNNNDSSSSSKPINKDNNYLTSEMIIKENQSFVSEHF